MRGWGGGDNREWDLLKKLQQVQFSQDRWWEGGGDGRCRRNGGGRGRSVEIWVPGSWEFIFVVRNNQNLCVRVLRDTN